MREILFRAKRMDNKEWVEGLTLQWGGDADIQHKKHLFLTPNGYSFPLEVDSETVCEYTGLTDKNGRKIFENDFVSCRQYIDGNWVDYCIERGYVEMKHGAFGLHRKQGYYRPFKDWLEDYEYEVIGNIFDNPELLKGGMG